MASQGPPAIPARKNNKAPLKATGGYGYDLDEQPPSNDYGYEQIQYHTNSQPLSQRLIPSMQHSSNNNKTIKSASTQVDVEFPPAKAEIKPNPLLRNIMDDTPETTLAKSVKIKGSLAYERLLRVDGHFEGTLVSKGDLIVGKTGSVHGDIKDIKIVVCEGKIMGNLAVERVELRGKAVCHGNIVCKSLRMDPTVILIGTVVCDNDDGSAKNNTNNTSESSDGVEDVVRGGARRRVSVPEPEEEEEEPQEEEPEPSAEEDS